MAKTKFKNGRIVTFYLDEQTITLLGIIAGNNSLSKSSMIEVLVNDYSEKQGSDNKNTCLEIEKKKKLAELKEIEDKQDKIKALEPLMRSKEELYERAVNIIMKALIEDRPFTEIEVMARTHQLKFLHNKFSAEEIIVDAQTRVDEGKVPVIKEIKL
jgi:hypothetical protein